MIDLERVGVWLAVALGTAALLLGLWFIGKADTYVDSALELSRASARFATICVATAEKANAARLEVIGMLERVDGQR